MKLNKIQINKIQHNFNLQEYGTTGQHENVLEWGGEDIQFSQHHALPIY